MSEDSPKDGEAWMPFLKRKGRFAECMILGWQAVEDKIEQMTAQEFDLLMAPPKRDPRIDLLNEVSFRKRVEFLKEMGRLSDSDAGIIHKFADERNKLFHGNVFTSPHPVAMPQSEKNRLMELANLASQITMDRGFGVWYDEGTGDTGNKDLPKPERRHVSRLDSETKSEDAL